VVLEGESVIHRCSPLLFFSDVLDFLFDFFYLYFRFSVSWLLIFTLSVGSAFTEPGLIIS
jgi:hypothetical protein